MTLFRPPRRVVLRLLDGREIITHELSRAQADQPPPEIDSREIDLGTPNPSG